MTKNSANKLTYKGCNYFRQRIMLSILSGKSVKITDIRSNDDEPGLKEYEINLLRLIDKLSNGMVLDVNETGTEVFFQPGVLIGGNIDHECCKQRGIGYYLEVIFGLTPYFKKGLKITLKGVTNNEKDPSVDAFKIAAIPILKRFLVTDLDIEFTVKKRGLEPNGGGEIYFSCPSIKFLKPVQVMNNGKIKRIRGTVFSARVSPAIAHRILERAKGIFLKFIPDVYISVDHPTGQKAGKSPGFGASFIAESTTGVFFAADSVSKSGIKTVAEDIGEQTAFMLLEEICRAGCIDSSFQILACLYMALRQSDVSQYLFGPLSPYTVQFLKHLKDFFGVMFKLEPYADEEGVVHQLNKVLVTCTGIGYNRLS